MPIIFHSQKAFTLVEVIVTVAILSILASIGFSYYAFAYAPEARDATRKANIRTIYNAMDIYQQNGQIDRLPKPANATLISSGSEERGYQGEVFDEMVNIFDIPSSTLYDPDGSPYLYRFDQKRRKFSLLTFLEKDPGNIYKGVPLAFFGSDVSHALSKDKSDRHPFIVGELEFYLLQNTKSLPRETASGKLDLSLIDSATRTNTRAYRDIHNLPPEAKCAPGPRVTSTAEGIGSPLCSKGSAIEFAYDATYGWRWKCRMEQSSTNCSAILPATCKEVVTVSDEPPGSQESCQIGVLDGASMQSTQTGFSWSCGHVLSNNITQCSTIGKAICGPLVGSSVPTGATVSTFSGASACAKGYIMSGSVQNMSAWWQWGCDTATSQSGSSPTQSLCYAHNPGLVFWSHAGTGVSMSGSNMMMSNIVGPHRLFSQNTAAAPLLNTSTNLSKNNFHPSITFAGNNELRGAENVYNHIRNSNIRGQWGYSLHSSTSPFSYLVIARDEIGAASIGTLRSPMGVGTQCSFPGFSLSTTSSSTAGYSPLYNGSFRASQSLELANGNRAGNEQKTQFFGISSLNQSTGSPGVASVDGRVETLFSTSRQSSLGRALCVGGSYGRPWIGQVMEVMIYASDITSDGSLSSIQSYLALKHGITLDQALVTNNTYRFASSEPDSVWQKDALGIFDENIAGIGRDSSFPFYQKQANSVNPSLQPIISVGNQLAQSNQLHTGSIGIGRFLTWSSDSGNTRFSMPASGVGGLESYMERRWRVQKTDNWTQGVSMYFRESDLESGDRGKNLSLIISNNPEFSSISAQIPLSKETIQGTPYFVARSVFFLDQNAYFSLATNTSNVAPIQSPAAWIRTDTQASLITNGEGITQWRDHLDTFTLGLFPAGFGDGNTSVGDGFYSTSAATRPKYHSTTIGKTINFNPSLEFGSTTNALQIGSRIHAVGESFAYFVVAKDLMTSSERSSNYRVAPAGFGSSAGDTCNYPVMNFHRNSGLGSSSYNTYGPASIGSNPTSWPGSLAYTYNSKTSGAAFSYPRAQVFGLTSLNSQVGFDNIISYIDGYREVTQLEANASSPQIGSALCIGTSGNGPGSNWRGLVSEVLAYSGPLSPKDLQRIHSYFAIKYAVGLDTRNDDNKVIISSIGKELWKSPVGYTGNFAAIGRDDNFGLYQRQSQSSTNTPNIIISIGNLSEANHLNTGVFANNQDFMVWSDNNVSGISRTWRIESIGDLPTISIAYPQSLSAGAPTLRLASNPEFSGTLLTLPTPTLQSIGGASYWVTTVDLPNNALRYLKRY